MGDIDWDPDWGAAEQRQLKFQQLAKINLGFKINSILIQLFQKLIQNLNNEKKNQNLK